MASQHIRVLPVNVANKIAAGEVVERPASVLKELLENAFDAEATHVDVEITAGGRRLIAVSDNGQGMGRDDALLSLERMATSKIRDVDDIEHIDTLGFRGEALAAIASVSRLRLVTCDAEGRPGTEILVAGGTLRDVRDIGAPVGTLIEARDLFFNVPARRKFLRSYQTELSHVRAQFLVHALGHPEAGLTLKVDGRMAYELAGGATLEERIRELFGPGHEDRLRAVRREDPEVKVTGYVGLPELNRADRNEQYLFVNGRATGAPLLAYAIREGYHSLLAKGRHPTVFLFVTLDPGLVDVNVHPTKKEVRFRHPSAVRDAVIAGIRDALQLEPAGGAAGADAIEHADEPLRAAGAESALQIEDLPHARAFKYPRLPVSGAERQPSPGDRPPLAEGTDGAPEGSGGAEPLSAEAADSLGSTPWAWCRVLGQVGSLYVVLETEDGLVLMDPHAAHERVLYERFMKQFQSGRIQTQNLLMPENVELAPKDALRVRKSLDLFKKMGFGIAEFGGDAFVVDCVPSAFTGASMKHLLVEVARHLEEAGGRGGKERWREESITQAACKAAVKARDRLTLEEIERLVIDLARTDMPYTCPHGRPTLILTSFHELNRKFGRE